MGPSGAHFIVAQKKITMNISQSELEYCFDKVAHITQFYLLEHLASDDPERDVEHLIQTCNKYLNGNIRVLVMDDMRQDNSPILGAYIAKVDGADICLIQGLNHCWTRFVTCKEVFHVVLDKEEYRNMSISEHVDEVTVAFPDSDASTPGAPVLAEKLAEIAAMEFLIPYKQRIVEIGAANGEGVNHTLIAAKYKVPRVLVETYFSSSYMESLAKYSPN